MLQDMQMGLQASARTKTQGWFTGLRGEWFLAFSIGTCVAFFFAGNSLFANLINPVQWTIVFLWLFSSILGSALSVVRHAEGLAERLGEPYGTLILTLSVTSIEVMSITAVMLHGENNPTLARDTMFAVVMIVLNGMVGLSLLLGALRHREQHYNLQGANIYLSVIIPLAVMAMILPDYTRTTPGPTLSASQQAFLVFASIGLYCAFLAVQTGRHRGYFSEGETVETPPHHSKPEPNILFHAVLLLAYMLPVVFLAEQLAHPVDHVIETLRMPAAIGGIIIAVIVATPEAIGAVHAARVNHMQRSVNIFLGSVLSTIGLTVPGIIIVSRMTGHEIILGVQNTDFMMLILTLAVAVVTFASGRTNVLQGAVHLLLFATYCLLIFQN
jgi:Ca2+:H+ antiporter